MPAIINYLKQYFLMRKSSPIVFVQHINRNFKSTADTEHESLLCFQFGRSKEVSAAQTVLELLLKDSDKLVPLKRHYHRLFKREISQAEIIDELLGYNEELRRA